MQKERLRQSIKKRLCQLKSKTKQEKVILKKLFQLPQFQASKNIFTYVSRQDEVDTISIIKYCLQHGKNVFVPKTNLKGHTINVYQMSQWGDLQKGNYGILEPDTEKAKLSKRKNFDIILVPGLGFDKACRRLGRGKGYFDRFLGKIKGYKIGLCYKEQICSFIPKEKYDINMDLVISGKSSPQRHKEHRE